MTYRVIIDIRLFCLIQTDINSLAEQQTVHIDDIALSIIRILIMKVKQRVGGNLLFKTNKYFQINLGGVLVV